MARKGLSDVVTFELTPDYNQRVIGTSKETEAGYHHFPSLEFLGPWGKLKTRK